LEGFAAFCVAAAKRSYAARRGSSWSSADLATSHAEKLGKRRLHGTTIEHVCGRHELRHAAASTQKVSNVVKSSIYKAWCLIGE
jgi:hypothetical protein